MKKPALLMLALFLLAPAVLAQTLGTTNLLEGSPAGSDSVVLAANGDWTATANSPWLHLIAASQSGQGSTNVIFTFDTNSGATRTGALTIAGQTLTVTQASSTCVAITNLTALVPSGLNQSHGVAADYAGNVYIAVTLGNAIKEWVAASNTVITLVSSGLGFPWGVAVDGAGNVYIADSSNNAIKEWVAASNTIITLVSSGLNNPEGVAVDGAGNVFIADTGNNAIEEWVAASSTVTTLVSSGLNNPEGVAVDGVGNVYFSDAFNNAIKEWAAASNTVITLVSSGLSQPYGVAVDGAGNVYVADTFHNAVKKWVAASNTVTTLVSSGLSNPYGVAVDGASNVYIADTGHNAIKELPRAFVDDTAKTETVFGGNDALPAVLPATASLTGPFAPASDSVWLTITGATNGVVSFAFTANNNFASRTARITLLGRSIAITQPPVPYYRLSTTSLLEGSPVGSNDVALVANGPWTATANDAWLHLSAASQSGPGSTNVVFTFDANLGPTRTGTLTIAGQTLTVTQAGSSYVAANTVIILVWSNSITPLSSPRGVAADSTGNVYIADTGNSAIKEWLVASNSVTTLVSSNSITSLNNPWGIALDGTNNVYIADTGNNAIKEWLAAGNTVTTLVSSGLSTPQGVAVDASGNVYLTDYGHGTLKKWVAASNSVTTLGSGSFTTRGVAVDGAGNVYFAASQTIKEWVAASNSVTTLVSSQLTFLFGVAVDGAGNVYIADPGDNAIQKWVAASRSPSVINSASSALISSGLYLPYGVAVDGAGNVYIADTGNNAIKELPRAFVDPTAKTEPAAAGSDVLPVVLSATASLTGPFAPVSDSAWLTITGVTNGVVSFAFSANNTLANRTANITLLGQRIPIFQPGPANYYSLATTSLLEGSSAGGDSVVLAANGPWTATANASWLHLSAANQSGLGSTVIFTFDVNSGATRTGTLTIAGQTLTVTQAGSTYVPITTATTLVSSGLSQPYGVTVDGAGNVYIADTGNSMIKEWVVASNTVTTLVSSGLYQPSGVAVDGAGNVFIADTFNNAIKEWVVASNTVTTLVSSGLISPWDVTVDGAGNVYIADTFNNAIKEWVAANNTVTTLVSSNSFTPLYQPQGVTVDGAGNVYFPNSGISAINEWVAASNSVITLVSSGYRPSGVAVDGGGNVYMAAQVSFPSVYEWLAASNSVATLLPPSSLLRGVAVDGAGNVYAATIGGLIEDLPHAFVVPTVKTESVTAGSDALPVVLPATANLTGPFTPASDSAWLTITGVTNGVVNFAFTANSTPTSRTANITLLGKTIPVIQAAVQPPVLTGFNILGNGAFQFGFTNNQGGSFTVWSTTNLSLPFTNWTMLGTLTNVGSGIFGFTDPTATNDQQRFYRVTAP
jgi:DNA-binding beta-propeller fold protein YncE